MTQNDLSQILLRIDNRPYPAYKDTKGRYAFDTFSLSIDRVQGDPFASPSRLSISILHRDSQIPTSLFSNPSRRTGLENYLALSFSKACKTHSRSSGSGKSGQIYIDTPGQEMLLRSCVEVGHDSTTLRFNLGLPANGRRIRGREAEILLCRALPAIVEQSICYENIDQDLAQSFADTAEDADALRSLLTKKKWLAFVANGSILPRKSGVDQRPLEGAVPFQSPPSLQQMVQLPNIGSVSGMAIPEGITLIVGGGYHGKSTLLEATERGVYNHRPDDGREYVVARQDATKVRAEDGRFVKAVDLSPFINNLPGGKNAKSFSTDNASGSSSQAAAFIEALETGAKTILLDEDISASNLLIRDARMQKLIAPDKEPITPLTQRIRSLFQECGVSTIMVLGGSGDYFETADLVIAMDNYTPKDLTKEAKSLVDPTFDSPSLKLSAGELALLPEQSRRFADPASINPFARGRVRIKSRGTRSLAFGENEIDLSLVPQLIDDSQVHAIGALLTFAEKQGLFDELPLPLALSKCLEHAKEQRLSRIGNGDLAEVRLQELAAALNRMRSLQIKEKSLPQG